MSINQSVSRELWWEDLTVQQQQHVYHGITCLSRAKHVPEYQRIVGWTSPTARVVLWVLWAGKLLECGASSTVPRCGHRSEKHHEGKPWENRTLTSVYLCALSVPQVALLSAPIPLCASSGRNIHRFFRQIWPNDGFYSSLHSTSRDCVLLFRQRAKQGRSLGPRKLRAREPASRPKLWTCTSEAVAWFRDSLCPTLFRRRHPIGFFFRKSLMLGRGLARGGGRK